MNPPHDFQLLHSGHIAETYISSDGTRICKQFHEYICSDPFLKQEILSELQLCAELRHNNILPIEAIEHDEESIIVYSPWVSPVESGDLSESELIEMLMDCAAALDHAHRLGHVHRSLHAGNIHRKPDGSFCISDFFSGRTQDTCTITGTSFIALNAMEIAPELLQGCRTDPRIDIFSLGKTALHIWGRQSEQLENSWLRDLLESMQASPENRPKSAAQLLRYLKRKEAPEKGMRPCPFCGEEKAYRLRFCPHCRKTEPLARYYDRPDASALFLSVQTEDSERIDMVRSILSHFSGKPVSSLELIIGDARKYSKAEKKNCLSAYILLAAPISESNADEIIAVFHTRIPSESITLVKHRYHVVKDKKLMRSQQALFPLVQQGNAADEASYLQKAHRYLTEDRAETRQSPSSINSSIELALAEAGQILRIYGSSLTNEINELMDKLHTAAGILQKQRSWLQQPRLMELYYLYQQQPDRHSMLQAESEQLRKKETQCIHLEQKLLEQISSLQEAARLARENPEMLKRLSELGIQALL